MIKRIYLLSLSVFLALVFLASHIHASSVTAAISGKVTTTNGQPIINICVDAVDQRCTGTWYSTRTDGNGDYTITLPAGDYYVRAYGSCDNQNYSVQWWDNGTGTIDCGQASGVQVNTGLTKTGINFSLLQGGSISGRVTDFDNQTVANICVNASSLCGAWYGGTQTDENGYYSIIGLPPGNCYISVNNTDPPCEINKYVNEWWNDTDGVIDCQQAQAVIISSGQTISDINFALTEGGIISGKATTTDGQPIEDICIDTLDNLSGNIWYGGRQTDEDGNYFIVAPPGIYRIHTNTSCIFPSMYPDEWWDNDDGTYSFDRAEPITVVPGIHVADINFFLSEGGFISGSVRAQDGSPIKNVCVDVVDNRCSGTWYGVRTDDAGNYHIVVPEGDFYVNVNSSCSGQNYVDEWWNNDEGTGECSNAAPVTVGKGETTPDINFILEDAGTISGNVVDEGTGNPVDDSSTGSIQLNQGWHKIVYRQEELEGGQSARAAFKSPGDTAWRLFSTSELQIKTSLASESQTGIFLITKKNTWGERPHPTGHESLVQCVDRDALQENGWYGQSIVNAINQNDNIHGNSDLYTSYYEAYFYVAIPGLWYFSTDSDDASEIVIDEQVVASWYDGHGPANRWDHKAEIQLLSFANREGVSDLSADIDGNYTIQGIPTGKYIVRARASGYSSEYFEETFIVNEAAGVDVSAGVIAGNINFTLRKEGLISGRVTSTSGQGITHVRVRAFADICRENLLFETCTDSNGLYTFTGLPETDLYLQACAGCEGLDYVDKWWDGDQGTEVCNLAEKVHVVSGMKTQDINFSLQQAGSVSGKLTTPDGQPIADAWIEAFAGRCWNTNLGGAQTDGSGYYTIHGLPEGAVYIHTCAGCENMDYLDKWWSGPQGAFDCDEALPVHVTAGENSAGIDFSLDMGGSISGRVTTNDGQPLDIVLVDAYSDTCQNGFIGDAEVDENGYFTLHGMPEGDVYVRACPNCNGINYITEWWDGGEGTVLCDNALPVTIAQGENITGVNFSLDAGGSFSGHVTNKNGQPIAGISIKAFGGLCRGGINYGSTTTDENGDYILPGIPQGDVYVYANPTSEELNYINEWWNDGQGALNCNGAVPVSVVVSQNVSGIDFSLDEGLTISGRVTNAGGQPLEDAWVQACSWEYNYCQDTETDEDGNYLLIGLLPGEVNIHAVRDEYVPEWWDGVEGATDSSAAMPLLLIRGLYTSGINFALDQGGFIAGRVTDTAGNPIPNIAIGISFDPCGNNIFKSTETDQDGNYSISDVPPGSVYIVFFVNRPGQNYVVEWWDGGQGTIDCSAAVPVNVIAGQTISSVDFSLQDGVTIEGRVISDSGQPLGNVPVGVFREKCDENITLQGGANTNENGDYSIIGLPEGPLYIGAFASFAGLNFVTEWWDDSQGTPDCTDAVSIGAPAGNKITGIDFELEEGGLVSGRITTVEGDPVNGMTVVGFFNKCYAFPLSVSATDDNGTYTMQGLPQEAVYIRTQSGSSTINEESSVQYVDKWWNSLEGAVDCNGAEPVSVVTGETTKGINISLELQNAYALQPDEPYQVIIKPFNVDNFSFAAEDGRSLLIEVVPQDGIELLTIDGKAEKIPEHAGSGDYTTNSITSRGSYELLISPTSEGAYYFSVFANNVKSSGGSYTITAHYIDTVYLSDTSISSAGNEGVVSFYLYGFGFTEDTLVTLTADGLPTISPDDIIIISSTEIYVTFNLSGVQPGSYSIQITKTGETPSTLDCAFQVSGGQPGHLTVMAKAPSAVRPLRNYTCWIEYGNDGGSDLQAPLFIVSNTVNAKMRLSENEPFKDGPIQVLGINFEGLAGTLPPGNTNRIPIYFKVPAGLPGHSQIEFNIEIMTHDATAIDWATLESSIRPETIADDVWSVIWSSFKSQLGSTWSDYYKALIDDANYISLYQHSMKSSLVGGELSIAAFKDIALYNIGTLLQFELAKASADISIRKVLASGQDIFMPEPGLSLSFGRFALQSIESRFRNGPLGRGWVHTYEYTATKKDNNDIIINNPDGSARIFTYLSDGNYQGLAGDYGSVSIGADTIVLLEKNGMLTRFGSNGKLSSIEDTNSNKLTLTYAGENLVAVTHSNGEAITFDYDGNKIKKITDPSGKTVLYRHDGSGEHLQEVEKPGGVITSYDYNSADGSASAHALASIISPDGKRYNYAYDEKGRVKEEWHEGDAKHITYSYDKMGTVTVTDAVGNTVLVKYGAQGEVLELKDALGASLISKLDGKTQVPQLINSDGKAVSIAYDTYGNSVGIENPLKHLIQMYFEHDFSNLTKVVDSRSNETGFFYDETGNLEEITYPDTTAESFAYDGPGNMRVYTNRRSDEIQYDYNVRGQITRKTYFDGRTIDYTYDAKGNLVSANDSLTGAITMEYDVRNFLTKIEYPEGYWFTFAYNNAGLRTKRTSHDGQVVNYYYDYAGRLEQMTDGSGNEIIRYEYDANGMLKKEAKGNGTWTTYEYDPAGQLLHMVNYAPGGAIQSRFDYTYDTNGNRTSMTTLSGTTSYKYDATGQLIGVTYPNGNTETYEYDAAGNRITVNDKGAVTSYTTNNMNQYTQAGAASYTYDADGNMISKTDSEGITNYTYDAENRLTGVATPSGGIWEYKYDALGNRISVIHNGSVTRYMNDPAGLVDVAAEYDGSGTLISRYIHGFGLVAKLDGSGNESYYSFDAIGHTRQMTNAMGTVINTYDYSPFGINLQIEESVTNPFRYVGRFGVMDEGNDLKYMRARYYSKQLGRFINQDPVRLLGGLNLYIYVNNSPVEIIDPRGLFTEDQYTQFLGRKPRSILEIRDAEVAMLNNIDMNTGEINSPSTREAGRQQYNEIVNKQKPWVDELNANLFSYSMGFAGAAASAGRATTNLIVNLASSGLGIVGGIIDQARGQFKAKPKPFVTPKIKTTETNSENITSDDPNEKTGTMGVGDEHYVVDGSEMKYTIYFENKSTASAPAQEVFINDYLDEDLDWSTLSLGEIGFGKQVISGLMGKQDGYERVILEDMAVDIEAKRYTGTGLVSWTLRTIDLETGELPEDAYAGFLPPEDGTGSGQGYVTFTVHAKNDRPAGTMITNKASIVFDTEAAISTNEVFNTITDTAPAAPSEPSIADGATTVSVTAVLGCASSEYAISYDVYLWESGKQKPAQPIGQNMESPNYIIATPLQGGETYNWQFVARNVMGVSEGPIWQFTTEQVQQPVTTTTINDSGGTNTGGSSGGGGGGGGGGAAPITTTTSVSGVTTIPATTTTTTVSGATTTTIPVQPPPESTTTTTTGTPKPCAFEQVLGNENVAALNTLRRFRDQKLAGTPAGAALIQLYYSYTEEITNMLTLNQALQANAKNIIIEMLPVVSAGRSITLTKAQHGRITGLLKTLQRDASPGLKKSIFIVLEKLDSGELFTQINGKVMKKQ